jgi:membrane protease YdiL (CAAX protease family)
VIRIPDYLTEPRSPLRSILLGWPTASIPALALAALASLLFPTTAHPDFGQVAGLMFVALVVISPALETLIMAAGLELLLKVVRPAWAIAISSIGWGIAHSLSAPAWGLVIWWPFLIFSALYVAWRKHSFAWALAVPMAVHALNNLPPALLLLRNG